LAEFVIKNREFKPHPPHYLFSLGLNSRFFLDQYGSGLMGQSRKVILAALGDYNHFFIKDSLITIGKTKESVLMTKSKIEVGFIEKTW